MAGKSILRPASFAAVALIGSGAFAGADGPPTINVREILRNVVPKDAIPALVVPRTRRRRERDISARRRSRDRGAVGR
jgi:hypothetical protein